MSVVDAIKYKRIVDNNMMWQGDISEEDKLIRINKEKSKKKGSVIRTIIHEERHATHPNEHEKTVYKKEAELVKKLSPEQKQKLYNKYK